MANLKQTRADIVNTLLEKHLERKLSWQPREGEDSFQTEVAPFVFHIDRKPIGAKSNFKIWIFDQLGNDLDSFNTNIFDDRVPENTDFDSFTRIAGFIYNSVKEKVTLDQINPALDILRSK